MSSNVLKEAERVMGICNACRYCEGLCAVFPAMELRRTFTGPDLKYFANLCHNCRGCYYTCQYAPPHEFSLNVPQALAELRIRCYDEFAWPSALKGIFQNNGLIVSLITALGIALTLILVLFASKSELFETHIGIGSFYQVIPYYAMVLPMSALALLVLYCLWKGIQQWVAGNGGSAGRYQKFRTAFSGHPGGHDSKISGWRRTGMQLSG